MTMFPVVLDLARLPAALVGTGPAAVRRLAGLDAAGAPGLRVYDPSGDAELARAAGDRYVARLPGEEDLAGLRVLFVAGLDAAASAWLAETAQRHAILTNVEDRVPLCEVHVPAIVRRGALLLAVSTGGGSPVLARRLREFLERLLPPVWADRLAELAVLRSELRASGAKPAEVASAVDLHIQRHGWLPG